MCPRNVSYFFVMCHNPTAWLTSPRVVQKTICWWGGFFCLVWGFFVLGCGFFRGVFFFFFLGIATRYIVFLTKIDIALKMNLTSSNSLFCVPYKMKSLQQIICWKKLWEKKKIYLHCRYQLSINSKFSPSKGCSMWEYLVSARGRHGSA